MKIVLIGAGSAQFGYVMLEDIVKSRVLQEVEIALLDINEQAVRQVYQQVQAFIRKHHLSISVTAGTDRPRALKEADFIIISIEVGNRFELWDQDWSVPQQYGIRQVYGENGGPGGTFHALRIIPPILDICSDIMNICPEARVFCYSNPMTPIVMAVKRRYPQLNFIGMCHEIASLKRYLPILLNTPLENIFFRAAGLNHLSVLLDVSYQDSGKDVSGKDAYSLLMEKAYQFFAKEPGYSEVLTFYRNTGAILNTEGGQERFTAEIPESSRLWSDRTLFKHIMDHFKLLPITCDSHLGEYLPWAHEAADHRGILDFYTYYRFALAQAAPDLHLNNSTFHERAVPMMEAFIQDSGAEEAAVNILNNGYIPDLPDWLAVEIPARVHKEGLKGIFFPHYPKGFGALLRNYAGVYDLTVEAVLQKKKDLVIQALLVNPVVDKIERVPELVDVMLDRQEQWLAYLQ